MINGEWEFKMLKPVSKFFKPFQKEFEGYYSELSFRPKFKSLVTMWGYIGYNGVSRWSSVCSILQLQISQYHVFIYIQGNI